MMLQLVSIQRNKVTELTPMPQLDNSLQKDHRESQKRKVSLSTLHLTHVSRNGEFRADAREVWLYDKGSFVEAQETTMARKEASFRG